MEQNTKNTNAPSGETYGYKGWLNSDSFIKRAMAVYGYGIIAGLIIAIPMMLIMIFMGGFFGAFLKP